MGIVATTSTEATGTLAAHATATRPLMSVSLLSETPSRPNVTFATTVAVGTDDGVPEHDALGVCVCECDGVCVRDDEGVCVLEPDGVCVPELDGVIVSELVEEMDGATVLDDVVHASHAASVFALRIPL